MKMIFFLLGRILINLKLLNRLLEVPAVRQNISEKEARWLPFEDTLNIFIELNDMDSFQNLLEKYVSVKERIQNKKWVFKWENNKGKHIQKDIPLPQAPVTIAYFLKIVEEGHLEAINSIIGGANGPLDS